MKIVRKLDVGQAVSHVGPAPVHIFPLLVFIAVGGVLSYVAVLPGWGGDRCAVVT